ncbi:MAG: acetamidase/formamidase family protein [Desulfovibrio sp.]|uniref:acetamidase/formamidase family protein n=1 Tax=Desulfovibrio sp. 7SRBS1 TaxID=3378064 RepID=UPI003B3C4E15
MFISKRHHVFFLDKKNTPSHSTDIPAYLSFETMDCFSDQDCSSESGLDAVDFGRCNPATGPVYLNGVTAGDVIRLDFKGVLVKSPGKMVVAPGVGALGEKEKTTEVRFFDLKEDKVVFNEKVSLDIKPVVGVIGVAPAGEGIACGTSGDHGGNIDTRLIGPGASLYLPVFVDGALLAMGDLHAAMGDGEILSSGLEVAGEVDVEVRKAEGLEISMPMAKTLTTLSFIASDKTLEKAIEKASLAMAEFLHTKSELSLAQAAMLITASGSLKVCQTVNPAKTVRCTMPLEVLRKLDIDMDF